MTLVKAVEKATHNQTIQRRYFVGEKSGYSIVKITVKIKLIGDIPVKFLHGKITLSLNDLKANNWEVEGRENKTQQKR